MKRSLATLLSLGLACACSAGTPSAQAEPQPQAPLPSQELGQAPQVPLAVELEGRAEPEGFKMLATVQVHGRLAAPIDLDIEWDGEARLVEAQARETITWEGASGTITRSFMLLGQPSEVRVKARSISQAMGATASAVWPPRKPEAVPEVELVPIPATQINGVRIDKAVPLD